MKAPLFNSSGEKVDMVELPREIIGDKKPKKAVLWEVVRMYQANRRRGTHKTKSRGELAYSTAKLFPQKGLGRARHGSRSANIFVGGYKAFGPKPRDYSYSVPKKVKRLALKMALHDRAMANRVFVVENIDFETPKTKNMVAFVNKLGLDGRKVMFVLGEYKRNVYLSGRNIPKVDVKLAKDINAMDVLNYDYVVIEQKGLKTLEERLT